MCAFEVTDVTARKHVRVCVQYHSCELHVGMCVCAFEVTVVTARGHVRVCV